MPLYPNADPETKPTVARLRATFMDRVGEAAEHRGDLMVRVDREVVADVLRFLRDDPATRYDRFLDLCGVDWLGREPRFDVVYHLHSLPLGHRVRLKCSVPEDDPVVESAVSVYRGADWFERECYDLLGIRFRGHPHLRRILCHDEFQGHALRKDYDVLQRWRCTRVSDLEAVVEVPEAAAGSGGSHP